MDDNELVSKFASDLVKFFATKLEEARQQVKNVCEVNNDLSERISRFNEGQVDIFSDIASSIEDEDGVVKTDLVCLEGHSAQECLARTGGRLQDDLFNKLLRTRCILAGSNKEVQVLTYANDQLEREVARLRAEIDTLRYSNDEDEQHELDQGEASSSAISPSDRAEPTMPLGSAKRVRWSLEGTENDASMESDEPEVPARAGKRRSEDNLESVRKKQNMGDVARHGSEEKQAGRESHSPNVGACSDRRSITPACPRAQESEAPRDGSMPEDEHDEPDPINRIPRAGHGNMLLNLHEDIKQYLPAAREVLYTPGTTVYTVGQCIDHVRIVAPSTRCHPTARGLTWELEPSILRRIAIGDTVELFDDLNLRTCYLGVYQCSGNGCMTGEQFQELPEKVREALLTKTFPNRRQVSPSDREVVRSLYATGERTVRYIDIDRKGFSEELYDAFQNLKKELEGMQ